MEFVMKKWLICATLLCSGSLMADSSFEACLEQAGYRFWAAQHSMPELFDQVEVDLAIDQAECSYQPVLQALADLEACLPTLEASDLEDADHGHLRDALAGALQRVQTGVALWTGYVMANAGELDTRDYARLDRIMRSILILERFEVRNIQSLVQQLRAHLMLHPFIQLSEALEDLDRDPVTHVIIEHGSENLPAYIERHAKDNPEQVIHVHILQEYGEPVPLLDSENKRVHLHVYPVSYVDSTQSLKLTEELREVAIELREAMGECLSFGNRIILQSRSSRFLNLSVMRPLYDEWAADSSKYAHYQLQIISVAKDGQCELSSGPAVSSSTSYTSLDDVCLYEPWFYQRWFS